MKLAARTFDRSDYYITSKFGTRTTIKTSAGTTSSYHKGTDYGTNGNKWPQYPLEDGIVTASAVDSSGANYVKIKYSRIGLELGYWHLDSRKVSKGQSVTHSTILGYTGMTGKATGVHLHLQVWKNGTLVNPESIDYTAPTYSSSESSESSGSAASGAAQKYSSKLAGTYVTTANVNVRSGPSTDYKILTTLPTGTTVHNYGYYTDGNGAIWYYIWVKYNNVDYFGHIYGNYLKKRK